MATWAVQDAKARFSEFLEASLTKGPQVVTKRGLETAVLIPVEEWRRLQRASRPTLKEWLLGPGPTLDKNFLPQRKKEKERPPVRFE